MSVFTYRCAYGCSKCPHRLDCSICGANVPRLHATAYNPHWSNACASCAKKIAVEADFERAKSGGGSLW